MNILRTEPGTTDTTVRISVISTMRSGELYNAEEICKGSDFVKQFTIL
jgi:hypothetical protein